MASVGNTLLNVLKNVGEVLLQTAAEEVGPIEAAGLQALNTLIADLLAKAVAAKAPQATPTTTGS